MKMTSIYVNFISQNSMITTYPLKIIFNVEYVVDR